MLSFNQGRDDRYPPEAAYLEGGSAEAPPKELKNGSEDPFTWMPFGAMPSQLENPKICICPSDRQTGATTFDYASRDRGDIRLGSHLVMQELNPGGPNEESVATVD